AFVAHGVPKLLGGPETWAGLGSAMTNLGVHFAPAVWGLAAACSEAFGGVLLAAGLLFRPACLALLATMLVALSMHLGKGDPFLVYSHALEDAVVFLALLVAGPGRLVLPLGRG
ncbi:MAG: DoxX family protein, partial [Nitrospirae bacterium]